MKMLISRMALALALLSLLGTARGDFQWLADLADTEHSIYELAQRNLDYFMAVLSDPMRFAHSGELDDRVFNDETNIAGSDDDRTVTWTGEDAVPMTVATAVAVAQTNDTGASSSSSPLSPSTAPTAAPCGPGILVEFVRAGASRELCYCPYDVTGNFCQQRRQYRCPPSIIAPINTCSPVPIVNPTSSLSTTSSDPPFALNDGGRDFAVYDPALSVIQPPCLALPPQSTDLQLAFDCHFADRSVREWWGNEASYNQTISEGFVYNASQPFDPAFRYAVLNYRSDGSVKFAQSVMASIVIDFTLFNSAHPSLSLVNQSTLTIDNLRTVANGSVTPVAPLILSVDVSALHRDLKRGGRLYTMLGINSGRTRAPGLRVTESLMPWRLTLEDRSFILPPPIKKPLLTKWQGVILGVVLGALAVLIAYRWYQRRQTAKMQELLAQQRAQGSGSLWSPSS